MKLDWFMLSVIDVRIPDESDEAARIRGAIVDEAASFLEAGSLTLEDWRKEPLRRTFWDGIARLASALN